MNAMLSLPVEASLARLQSGFADAVFFDDQPIPATIRAASGDASASRFGVYRNNVIAGLINAVGARYPVARNLLWPESFDHFARMYVTVEPPCSPVLLDYGDSFPQFLRRVGEGASAEYLADIAELEAARTRAYHAADATPVNRDTFARLAADELPDLRLKLHPSLSLLKSRFPVVTAWDASVNANDISTNQWKPESALIARPHLAVGVWRLPRGAYEFIAAIADGHTIGSAISYATENATGLDLSECINILIAAEIVVGIEHPGGVPALGQI